MGETYILQIGEGFVPWSLKQILGVNGVGWKKSPASAPVTILIFCLKKIFTPILIFHLLIVSPGNIEDWAGIPARVSIPVLGAECFMPHSYSHDKSSPRSGNHRRGRSESGGVGGRHVGVGYQGGYNDGIYCMLQLCWNWSHSQGLQVCNHEGGKCRDN
ncbi:hypothetical protein PIB30_039893 [Stylosanthes scabra]|uniref:Uncharacterized protein n=1 Tax=Stylosanthes scabra TaxID=79078 RepID=A0ABU6YD50_9FABA|nr:hypothetical protein [Stylosanthes scabra]